MPKILDPHELESFATVISCHPDGLVMAEILEKLKEFNKAASKLPTRTLQRRLKQLEKEGRISSEGRGKGKRYFPADSRKKAKKIRLSNKPRTVPLSKGIAQSPKSINLKQRHWRDHYAEEISECLRQVVMERLDQSQAQRWISFHATNQVSPMDQKLFMEVVKEELELLHPENIEKHHLKPSEFESWFQTW